ncbi:cytochrome P450 [Streptomyces sp. TRM S81-3]|uniref:Cytochrome P450 n=1 Tax=Streptomyces griseicoloratus TaxID=2752516 RepID=A0A926L2F2_9ACTN|nr:cytochrome P450 [Streptomyces griseicoloratus]MBD0420164.1 cytochrome P450 [Streptomyces griseicoloratus]
MTDTNHPVAYPQDRTCPYHPPAAYDALRATRPLARVTLYDGRTAWLVTGHETARRLLADQRLSTDRTRDGFPVTTARFAVRSRRTALLGVDDPEHRAQRKTVQPEFTLKRIAALRPRIQRIVDERLDAMIAQGPPAELVNAFALPVPSMVICALLGVPYDDHDFFEAQSRRLLRGPTAAESQDARDRLEAYLGELIDRKRREPGTGLLDDLVRRQPDDGPADRGELVALAVILLVAGHETTANMISLGTYTLLQHPERLAELRADPSLLPGAVEELMRVLSIADGLLRLATEDIEVAGQTIRAGDGVVFSTSVINRDETLYPEPDTLDWHRPARHHVAFGFGIHQCLGQNLARAELEIALHTLFERLPTLRLAAPAEEIPFKPGDTIQGMLELPVAW